MARRKKKKAKKVRNWLAVHAHFHKGAGTHGDDRKEQDRKACRGRVTDDE